MTTSRATTEVDVANLALVNYLGEQPIGTLGDNVNRARVIASVFGTARDAALRENDWDFATAYVIPAVLPDLALGVLQNRFPVPDDCLRVRWLVDSTNIAPDGGSYDYLPRERWDVEASTINPGDLAPAQTVIVTDVTVPLVCYTRRIALPALWDSEFIDVFAQLLAAYAAPGILKDPAISKSLRDEARERVSQAALENAREGQRPQVSRYTSWVAARRIGIVYRPPFRDSGM